jgi:cytochrome P450
MADPGKERMLNRMRSLTFNDLGSQETLRNPAAFYRQLREQEPLFKIDFGGLVIWIISATYDETIELLKDPRFVKDTRSVYGNSAQSLPYGETMQLLSQNMLGADPPDHTRLRGLVSKTFTPRMIEQLRPRIQQITDELLDAVQEKGQMDLVEEFALPLPITVISEMLGISVEVRSQFRGLTQRLINAFLISGPEQMTAVATAGQAFISYIKALVEEKRAHPGDDMTSSLLHVEENGDTLSENELISMIWLLIVAGHETTVNLISNGVLALLQAPEQMHLLQQEPALISSAIEELLRYTAPVVFGGARWASEDITLHGQVIHKGEIIRPVLSSANTDPQHFADPETLNIRREVNRHLAFGKGIHVCLGAPLARLEGQIAIGTLLQRLPHLQLACQPEELTWNPIPNLRGLTKLPVTF